jgi:hypothetical protein
LVPEKSMVALSPPATLGAVAVSAAASSIIIRPSAASQPPS